MTNDVLADIEQALSIYRRICDLMETDENNRVLLEKSAQKMRWAIQELIDQFWRQTKN